MAQIQVTVIEGRNIKKKDLFSQSDPFVEIYLDDKNQQQKTQVKHNSKNPEWNETIVLNHLTGQDTLHVDVCDKDPLKEDIIGSFRIDLRDLYEKNHIDNWYSLPSRFGHSSNGEIHLILDYQPLQL